MDFLLRKILPDNGLSFTSDEFKKIMETNGIKCITSAPYHPSTNSIVEMAGQEWKEDFGIYKVAPFKIIVYVFIHLLDYTLFTIYAAPSELLMG